MPKNRVSWQPGDGDLTLSRNLVDLYKYVTTHIFSTTRPAANMAPWAVNGSVSPGFDDHVQLFFPDPVTDALVLPTAGPDGPVWPEGAD